MLINIDYKNKGTGEYFCDVCGRRFLSNKIIKLQKIEKKKINKVYDLCSDCYKLFDKAMLNLKYKNGGQIIK